MQKQRNILGKKKIKLGVNIDHIATLRQVRGGTTAYPDLLKMTQEAVNGGADQITIHLREDRRHIQLRDLAMLSKECPVPLNLEMAATSWMIRYARVYKPDWVCVVPEKRAELTTEGGLDVIGQKKRLQKLMDRVQSLGIEVSFFIAPDTRQVKASFEMGADAIELHTGSWVRFQGSAKQKEWTRLQRAAELANELGMRVHAGHGLDYEHAQKISELKYLEEVNIGHSLVCYALEHGLRTAVKKMKLSLKKGS